jgi:hypothetical protein
MANLKVYLLVLFPPDVRAIDPRNWQSPRRASFLKEFLQLITVTFLSVYNPPLLDPSLPYPCISTPLQSLLNQAEEIRGRRVETKLNPDKPPSVEEIKTPPRHQ